MRFISLLLLLLLAGPVAAHPLELCHFDRTIAVKVEPGAVFVEYKLELSELSLTLDGLRFFENRDMKAIRGEDTLVKLYAEKKAELIANSGLIVRLNGTPLRLQVVSVGVEREPMNRTYLVKIAMRATAEPKLDVLNSLQIQDETNYVDVNGAEAIEADGSVSITLSTVDGVAEFTAKQPDDLKGKVLREILLPEDQSRRRKASATYRVSVAPVPSPVQTLPTQVTVAPDDRSILVRFLDRGPIILLDSPWGLGFLLLLAAGFGAAHAFTPGHGKTMVAAFLVGERGTIRQAVILGLTATLAHTGSVILVALLVFGIYGNTPPASAQGWLTMIGGALILFVGGWLLWQRLRGQADHVHLFPGHHHEPAAKIGGLRVILLGLGGGIIPCWDAVLLFLVAMAQGRTGLAIPLLLAFSVGLALVLVLLGIGVVLANRAAGRAFRERRWFHYLPLISATILIAFGLWFLRDGFRLLTRGVH